MTGFARALRSGALLALLAIASPLFIASASAATITIDGAKLSAIYSQSSFTTSPITVNVLQSAAIYDASLLNLSTNQAVSELFSLGPDDYASKIVDAFFVDSIGACGGTSSSIVGCANRPGHDLVVKSSYAATDTNETALGHELGHNLGLMHVEGMADLMNPVLQGSTYLDAAQASAVLQSPLVQTAADGSLYIDIRPILVSGSSTVASAPDPGNGTSPNPSVEVTPLPAGLPLFLSGISVLGLLARRKKRASTAA